MKKIILVVLAICFSQSAFAGNEGVHGGDEVALEFLTAIHSALANIQKESPALYSELNPLDLETLARNARTVVTDKSLVAVYQGVMQTSVAVNDPMRSLIVINRDRWKQITDERMREAIALHEVLSLKRIEDTGNYRISGLYVAGAGVLPAITADVAPGFLDEILVPVPGEIRDRSSVTIASPEDENVIEPIKYTFVTICAYSRGANGQPVFQSLRDCRGHDFNERVYLPAGDFVVYLRDFYHVGNPDNTLRDRYMMYFTLGEKEEKTIQLAKLNVPRIDGSYNFEVFVDVTNKVEQEKVLRALWIKAEPGELIGFHGGKDLKKNTFCKREEWHSGVALGIRVCAALKNDRYLDLLGSYIRFGTDATVDSLTDKFENYDSNDWNFRSVLFPEDKPERMVVGNGRDGESVYIFPGTYGIRFTSAGGHHTDHYGVVVK